MEKTNKEKTMSNGDENKSVEKIWETVDNNNQAQVNMAVKSSLIIIVEEIKLKPCKKHEKRIDTLFRFMWVLIGIGVLIEFLIKIYPYIKV